MKYKIIERGLFLYFFGMSWSRRLRASTMGTIDPTFFSLVGCEHRLGPPASRIHPYSSFQQTLNDVRVAAALSTQGVPQ